MAYELDAPLVNALLDIAIKTGGMPHYKAISEVATVELAQINADCEADLRPPPAEVVPGTKKEAA